MDQASLGRFPDSSPPLTGALSARPDTAESGLPGRLFTCCSSMAVWSTAREYANRTGCSLNVQLPLTAQLQRVRALPERGWIGGGGMAGRADATHRRAVYRRSIIYGAAVTDDATKIANTIVMDEELSRFQPNLDKKLLQSQSQPIAFPSATKFTHYHSLLSDTPLTHLKTNRGVGC